MDGARKQELLVIQKDFHNNIGSLKQENCIFFLNVCENPARFSENIHPRSDHVMNYIGLYWAVLDFTWLYWTSLGCT